MKILLAIFLFFITGPAWAADPVEGYWLTENERAVIHIQPCENSVCGSIYWIVEGGLQIDKHNPDEALRDRPICGLTILKGFEQEEPGEWEDGSIYKADDGDTYNANLEIMEDGHLKLRGYVGLPMFGKSQIWTPVNPAAYKACQ